MKPAPPVTRAFMERAAYGPASLGGNIVEPEYPAAQNLARCEIAVPVASGAVDMISRRERRWPPPRPQRVLAARRRLQDRGAGGPGGGARDARARAHRSRGDERRGRALQGVQASTGSSRSSGSRPIWSTIAAPRGSACERNHLTLLAATDAGFRNLVKLTSARLPRGLRARQGRTSTWSCSTATPRA